MSPLNPFKRRDAQRLTRVETNYGDVLLDAETGQYWHLNESAALVFSSLSNGDHVDDVVAKLATSYGISAERAREDVESVRAQMTERGLL